MIRPELHNQCIGDDDSFCFSLNLRKIYNRKYDTVIYISNDEIITFLRDIFKIYNHFFKNESICNDAREGKKYIYFDNQKSKYEINGGENTFMVEELEVFEILFL